MPTLDRQHVRIHRTHDAADDGGYMPGTPEERLPRRTSQTARSTVAGAMSRTQDAGIAMIVFE
jgi:hypothetical protein